RAPGDGWTITRRRDGTCTLRAIDTDGDAIGGAECRIADFFWRMDPARALLAVNLGCGGQWRARVFLLRDVPFELREVRFVHRVLCQIAPAMHNQYLLR